MIPEAFRDMVRVITKDFLEVTFPFFDEVDFSQKISKIFSRSSEKPKRPQHSAAVYL